MRMQVFGRSAVAGLAVGLPVFCCVTSANGQGTLPPVPFPAENQFSEAKRVLGKMLFWDEQLSTDNTNGCATCHIPASGGADPRFAVHPGPDGALGTPDDLFTSLGLINADAADVYEPDPTFGLDRQMTPRAANPSILAMYAPELFWDGRASSTFVDPQTGATVIANGGALESQAVGPIVSDVEMAHASRDWAQVTAKLRGAVPMALASNLTADVAAALAGQPGYPELFAAAFGDDAITAARIGMAIATYERTLVPDQTPWDGFIAGNPGAMTQGQIQGWNTFNASACRVCHTPPLFTDSAFHNIALRPNNQDVGREGVTGIQQDRGRFKTPSLRNSGLKRTLMHTGQFNNVGQVFPFYAGPGAPGNPNRDPILPAPIPPQAVPAVTDFIVNALTDPRVVSETFPFDRPALHSEGPANPAIVAQGVAGSGGIVPRMIANRPPNVGFGEFAIGLDDALAGATAEVAISFNPPVGGVVTPDQTSGPIVIGGLGIGNGFATFHWPIPADPALQGEQVWMQWRVDDPGAAGGVALSRAARLSLFCGGWCPDATNPCPADLNGDGVLDLQDVQAFVAAFVGGDPVADLNGDGVLDLRDVQTFIAGFTAGCP
ncbi:MAG: hypothetical protein H6810_05600 [Phycisphaeraceae bacterium]|nr:MAG: hypothetical protein H6810_05600 [Phycisphaeraceae bacterium]